MLCMLCYYAVDVAGTIYWDSGRLCHEITVYMLPVLYRPAVSYLRVECDMILLFLMYRLLCSLFFRNYVILCLFSGGGG